VALFAVSSLLLAVLLGTALGNVIRCVPLDHSGKFSMALFTHFGVRGRVGILDWYTVSVAAFTTALLAAHGATYLRLKTTGRVHERSDLLARRLWVAILILCPIVTFETWIVRPDLYRVAVERPLAWIGTLAVVAGAWAIGTGLRRASEGLAFAGSCAVIAGLLGGAAASAFPVMLHSTIAPEYSITAYDGATSGRGLTIALVWWPIAFVLSLIYAFSVYRSYGGKIA
jgi:cytochrome d ubiquinol oxidase subunit II